MKIQEYVFGKIYNYKSVKELLLTRVDKEDTYDLLVSLIEVLVDKRVISVEDLNAITPNVYSKSLSECFEVPVIMGGGGGGKSTYESNTAMGGGGSVGGGSPEGTMIIKIGGVQVYPTPTKDSK